MNLTQIMKNTLSIGIYPVISVNSYADRGRENRYLEIPLNVTRLSRKKVRGHLYWLQESSHTGGDFYQVKRV